MDESPRPRVVPFLLTLLIAALAVGYAIPLITTGDPLWPLPASTAAERLLIHWDGRTTELTPTDPRYSRVMDALNRVLSSPAGVEYRYGIPAEDVARLRERGRALEAVYAAPTRAHGAYATGEFTRVLVSLEGEEYERRLVFFGDARVYRAGPLRASDLGALHAVVEASR